jgi:hypothetical protein
MSANTPRRANLSDLMAEAVASPGPEPALLARYAENPERLSPEEREEVERAIAESPAVADQVRVLQRFDYSVLEGAAEEARRREPARESLLARLLSMLRVVVASPVLAYTAAALLMIPAGAWLFDALGPGGAVDAPGPIIAEAPPPPAPPEVPAGPSGKEIRLQQQNRELQAELGRLRAQVGTLEGELVAARTELSEQRQLFAKAEPPPPAPAPRQDPEPRRQPEAAPDPTEPPAVAPPLPEGSIVLAWAGPLYAAPEGAEPRRRPSGTTRGVPPTLTLTALAPDHVARTRSAQSALYWYLPELPPENAEIRFAVSSDQPLETLVDAPLPRPEQPGIQEIRLADYGVELPIARELQWSVSVVVEPDQPSLAPFTSGWIERVEDVPVSATGPEAIVAQARAGLWYDALADLQQLLARNPDNADLLRARTQLLREAGLGQVAEVTAR